ncbi:hypothetical protein PBY51_019481 [Eleginops maclovinus]|uniref:Uncharacterized protein n=1 Tax=Eleginops maclovinus TaxID=56733 RepID=A0AAN8AY31_ELEMC|nr:hypothetical protein PBY51_019481 [Eleginops maclovinus]
MDKFIVIFNVFGVGKTFEDWLKSQEDDGMTKAKDKAQGTRFRDLTDEELRTIEDGALESNTKKATAFAIKWNRVEEPPEG